MDNNLLKQVILDQRTFYNRDKLLIERGIKLAPFLNTELIVIISGIRRCGKSTLLYQFKEKIVAKKSSNFCFFNFDDERILLEDQILNEIYSTHIQLFGEIDYFFFDEIQNVPNWEKFVNRLYEQGKKVFITGSNSKLLSSEIATALTGRNRVLQLFPFSFKEYLIFFQKDISTKELNSIETAKLIGAFEHFLNMGGFPIILKENDLEITNTLFQDILYRDIVARHRITQILELKQIGLYLLSNIGKLYSYSTLQTISGIKSLSSVKNYLDLYEQSFLLFYLKKFDYSVKKQIANSRKVYTVDNALMHRIGFGFSLNNGRALENAVFIELRRKSYDIFYYSNKKECDFIIRNGITPVLAIQVVYELTEDNFQRELEGLKEAMSDLNIERGQLICMHPNKFSFEDESIEMILAWKWFLNY